MNEQAQTETTETTAEDAMTLDDVSKRYFNPENLHAAAEYMQEIMAIDVIVSGKVKPLRNFKEDEDFPDSYGIWILPISKRIETADGGKNKTMGLVFAGVPDLSALSEEESHVNAVRDLVAEAFAAKVANSVRPRGDETIISGAMPRDIADFIENRKMRGTLKTFNELAMTYVKALRKKGLKELSVPQFRQCLLSSDYAETHFTNLKQELWEQVLGLMIADAKKKQLDASILENWAETRNENEIEEVTEIDLSDLSGLMTVEDETVEPAEPEMTDAELEAATAPEAETVPTEQPVVTTGQPAS